MSKTMLVLEAMVVVASMLELHVSGFAAEAGNPNGLYRTESATGNPELINENVWSINSGISFIENDDDSHDNGNNDDNYEQAETEDCRPGASNWPDCRSVGYPGCAPGMVAWPQCQHNAKKGGQLLPDEWTFDNVGMCHGCRKQRKVVVS